MKRPKELPKKLTETSIRNLPVLDSRYDVKDHLVTGLYLTVYPSGRKSWVYRYRSEGKSKRYRIGDDAVSPTAARSAAKRIAGDIAKGVDPNAEKQTKRRTVAKAKEGTLRAFIDLRYEPWTTVETKSGAATVQTIRNGFDFLLDRPMESITHWELEKWRRNRHKDGISPSTTNRQIAALRGCLTKAIAWEVISEHPLRDFKLSKTDKAKKPRVLSEDQERNLRAALRARDAKMRTERVSANDWRNVRHIEPMPDFGYFVDHLEPMVLLALNTGMRRGEILQLRWNDILPDSLVVRGETAKSSQTREIPLNNEAREILDSWESNSEWVFPGRNETPMTTIKKSWANIRKDAGLMDLRFHDLRHSFGTRLLQRGSDIETVRNLLGHADVATTARYLHATDESKRKAVELL